MAQQYLTNNLDIKVAIRSVGMIITRLGTFLHGGDEKRDQEGTKPGLLVEDDETCGGGRNMANFWRDEGK